jgi:hypothetical protein
MMDYNRTIMLEASDPRARRRLTLLIITLATIPCYCIGWIAIMLAPDASLLAVTPTQVTFTETATLQIPTLTPLIVPGTATNTPTITPSPTFTSTPTLTPSATSTWTFLPPPSNTPSFTPTLTPSYTPSTTSTPTNTFTPTSSFTPVTPTITSFPSSIPIP